MNHELHGFGMTFRAPETLDDCEPLEALALRLQAENEVLRVVIDHFPGGIMVYDKNLRLVLCNRQQKRLLDYPPELFEFGLPTFEQIVRSNALRGEYGPGDPDEQVRARLALAAKRVPHHFERCRPDGTALEIRGVPLPGGGFLSIYREVGRKRRKAVEPPQPLPVVDLDDGAAARPLLDWVSFCDRVRQAAARARVGQIAALHCLDLDNYRPVASRLGPERAEKLILAVARRLRESSRGNDCIARLGEDEFLVLQADVARPSDSARLASRIVDAVRQPFTVDNHSVTIGASCGVALMPRDGVDAEALIARARESLQRTRAAAATTSRQPE